MISILLVAILSLCSITASEIVFPLGPGNPPYANVEIDLRDPQGVFWPNLLTARAVEGGTITWQETNTKLAFSANLEDWSQMGLTQERRVASERITYKPNPRPDFAPIAMMPKTTCALRSTGPGTLDEQKRLHLPVECILDLGGEKVVVTSEAILIERRQIPPTMLSIEKSAEKSGDLDLHPDADKTVPTVSLEMAVEIPAEKLGITRVPSIRVEIRTTAWKHQWNTQKKPAIPKPDLGLE